MAGAAACSASEWTGLSDPDDAAGILQRCAVSCAVRAMRRTVSTAWMLALLPLAACGTASWVDVRSIPEGARIYVEGVDTHRVTPANIDLESYAPDPDAPMRVEVRLAGDVPTVSLAYPQRHQCSQLVCEKKQHHYLSCRLPLFESGGGVRVEIHYEYAYEVAFDDGPWTAVDGPSLWPEDSAGRT